MISHVWTVVCSRAVIDQQTNNVSLESVLEKVTVEGEPAPKTIVPISFDVMTLCTRTFPDRPCQGRVRLEYFLPSRDRFVEFIGNVNLQNVLNHRTTMHLPGLALEDGRHLFVVSLEQPDTTEWQQVASIPVEMTIVSPKND